MALGCMMAPADRRGGWVESGAQHAVAVEQRHGGLRPAVRAVEQLLPRALDVWVRGRVLREQPDDVAAVLQHGPADARPPLDHRPGPLSLRGGSVDAQYPRVLAHLVQKRDEQVGLRADR